MPFLDRRIPRRTWPRLVPWRFPSLLSRSQTDTRNGYALLGAAVARELPKLAPRLAHPERVAALHEAMDLGDDRAVVEWLVQHAPAIMRRVPRERRYASFRRGIAGALAATIWSEEPIIATTKL